MGVALFRQEVVARDSRDWLGTVRLATPVSQRIWTSVALCVAAAVVAWLIFGQYTRREHVSGQLIPQAGLIAISSNTPGVISRVIVSEGDRVKANDPLIAISGEHVSETLGDTGTNISAELRGQQQQLSNDILDTQKLAVQQGNSIRSQLTKLAGQGRQIDEQIAIQNKQVAMEEELLGKVSPLLDKGYIPLFQIQQERSNLLAAQGRTKALQQQHYALDQQIVTLSDQLDQLPLATSVKLGELRRQNSQIEQTLAQNELGRASLLRAPKDGVVSSLLVGVGQAVTAGESLLAVVPANSPLQAQLLVPSRVAGFVHAGTAVVLHYQPFPYQKFGLQHGIVRDVSTSALSPSEVSALLGGGGPQQNSEPLYRVLVDVPAQQVDVYGRQEPLRAGMTVDGDLLLDRRTILEWVFEPLYAAGRRLTVSS